METQVKLSASGREKAKIRKSVSGKLEMMGFHKRGTCDFARFGEISPEEVRHLVDFVYDEEAKYVDARVVTFIILSGLNIISIRRDRNRSI